DKGGERFIPESQRADGSTRKAIKIRPGFRPTEDVEDKKGNKILRTEISHNDGSQWAYLPPPKADVNGKAYGCSSTYGDEKCALHLHHYTERLDKKKTFSAASVAGLMFGYGNIGSSLGPIEEADTFMTTDAGITWKSVKKGAWTWQYG
ncbi:hypothetical protein BN1723_018539, partial [Verticillium longisporum]